MGRWEYYSGGYRDQHSRQEGPKGKYSGLKKRQEQNTEQYGSTAAAAGAAIIYVGCREDTGIYKYI